MVNIYRALRLALFVIVQIASCSSWSNHYQLSIGGVYIWKDDSYHDMQMSDRDEQQKNEHRLRHQKKSYFFAIEYRHFLKRKAFVFYYKSARRCSHQRIFAQASHRFPLG